MASWTVDSGQAPPYTMEEPVCGVLFPLAGSLKIFCKFAKPPTQAACVCCITAADALPRYTHALLPSSIARTEPPFAEDSARDLR